MRKYRLREVSRSASRVNGETKSSPIARPEKIERRERAVAEARSEIIIHASETISREKIRRDDYAGYVLRPDVGGFFIGTELRGQ